MHIYNQTFYIKILFLISTKLFFIKFKIKRFRNFLYYVEIYNYNIYNLLIFVFTKLLI